MHHTSAALVPAPDVSANGIPVEPDRVQRSAPPGVARMGLKSICEEYTVGILVSVALLYLRLNGALLDDVYGKQRQYFCALVILARSWSTSGQPRFS
jgi:hypothetical protein